MKKSISVLIVLSAILLLIVGTAAGSKLLSLQSEVVQQKQPAISSPLENIVEDNQILKSFEAESEAVSIIDLAQQEEKLEARLKVTGDDVFYCGDCVSPETCEFDLIDANKQTLVEGDAVRTGVDGTASINFSNEVDLILSSNTQIRILKFQESDDGSIQIYIEHIVGELYFSVKYSKKESQQFDFKILTPTAVIEQTGGSGKQTFSGISTVQFSQFAGLPPEALAQSIEDAFSTQCGALCFENDCNNCLNFADLSPVDLEVDNLTGELVLRYINEYGIRQSTLFAGQTFRYIFNGLENSNTWLAFCRALYAILNGEEPSSSDVTQIKDDTSGTFVAIIPTPTCGDGVCDVYSNEDKKTCPQDCK